MSERGAPLSPHLQVYRWQIPMALSILHRATGIVLSIGAVLLTILLVAAASGPDSYEPVASFLQSALGRLVMVGFAFSLFLHLANGIRHLFWDAGWGFEIKTYFRSGWVVLITAVVATVVAWWIAFGGLS